MTRIHFAPFTLDLRTRQLLREGEEVPLSPKAYALLACLIEQRPRVVAKRELMDVIWPEVFVEEQNVKNLVNEIRTALSDSAGQPRFIRTVFGVGYAFHGETAGADPVNGRTLIAGYLVGVGTVYRILDGENLLGRDDDCSVVIEGKGISRHHARIAADGGRVVVEDLGSKNGTWLNGRRLVSAEALTLTDGDSLRIGMTHLTFRAAVDDETSTIGGAVAEGEDP